MASRADSADGAEGDDRAAGKGEQHITARKIILTTGSYSVLPKIEGLETVPYITSDGALSLDAPPESMVVIGGGPVALELGQFYARMGTRITILVNRPRILDRDDPEIGQTLQGYLRNDGLQLHTNATAKACRPGANGQAIVVAEVDGAQREFSGALVLVATGRRAATRGLGLENADVQVDEKGGFVVVDRAMCTSNPNVYCGR